MAIKMKPEIKSALRLMQITAINRSEFKTYVDTEEKRMRLLDDVQEALDSVRHKEMMAYELSYTVPRVLE